MTNFNHDRPLSDFQDNIDKLKANGYNPIAVTQIYFEDTFVFETHEEATKAYNQFEINSTEIVAYWYSKEDFLKEVEEYEKPKLNSKVRIYWLNEE